MNNIKPLLDRFILQANTDELKFAKYPKEYSDLRMRISFGQGVPAKIPWIAFIAPEMKVSSGFYPVYLYYKELGTLILSYGISETEEFSDTWPAEIMNSSTTIESYFDKKIPRYGTSFVFKSYKVDTTDNKVSYINPENNKEISDLDIESDLSTILSYYKKLVSIEVNKEDSPIGQGIFYMEKELENFIIHNWDQTELSKDLDLIIEDGEMISQQYQIDIGPIDILAKDKKQETSLLLN